MFEDYNENLSWIEQMIDHPFVPPGQGAIDYFRAHAIRYAWTLKYLSACRFQNSLELGSDGLFVYAQRLIDPQTNASGANFVQSEPSLSERVFWGIPSR